ncbi:MAG: hypothetical protein R3C02_03285 [Planctomycetaceae bacterium]
MKASSVDLWSRVIQRPNIGPQLVAEPHEAHAATGTEDGRPDDISNAGS